MRDARFRRTGLRLDVAQERLRGLAHRVQVAVHIASRPEPVIDRGTRVHVCGAYAQFMRMPERCDRFGCAMTVRGNHRVSIGNL